MVCYRAGNETEDRLVGMEGVAVICSYPSCFSIWNDLWVSRLCLLDSEQGGLRARWGLDKAMWWGKIGRGKSVLSSGGRCRTGRRCSACSAAQLGLRQEDWIWKRRQRAEDQQSAYLLPWQKWPSGSQGMLAGFGFLFPCSGRCFLLKWVLMTKVDHVKPPSTGLPLHA